MSKVTWRAPSGQALVSDQAASRLDPSAFDPSREPLQMRMVWNTDEGTVEFAYPSNLSEVDIDDIEALIGLSIRGMRRRASAIEARRAGTEGSGAQHESTATAGGDAQPPAGEP